MKHKICMKHISTILHPFAPSDGMCSTQSRKSKIGEKYKMLRCWLFKKNPPEYTLLSHFQNLLDTENQVMLLSSDENLTDSSQCISQAWTL